MQPSANRAKPSRAEPSSISPTRRARQLPLLLLLLLLSCTRRAAHRARLSVTQPRTRPGRGIQAARWNKSLSSGPTTPLNWQDKRHVISGSTAAAATAWLERLHTRSTGHAIKNILGNYLFVRRSVKQGIRYQKLQLFKNRRNSLIILKFTRIKYISYKLINIFTRFSSHVLRCIL